MTPARFRWGMLLILIGVLIMMTNMDLVGESFWEALISFFPILLIAIGLEKIFTKSKFQFVSYLTSVLVFAAAIFLAMEAGTYSNSGSFFRSKTIHQGARDSVKAIQAVLKLGDGDLTIRDATDELLYGRFREFSSKPRYDFDVKDGLAKITLTSRSHHAFGGLIQIETGDPDDWRLAFSRNVPLMLECQGDESDIHLNLASTPLRNLRLDADDAEIYIKLGNIEDVIQVWVGGNDSKLRLRVPRESGLRVTGNDHGYFREVGLIKRNGFFVNEGYDSLPKRIEVELEDRFRSLVIDYY